jgi:hypothetical protein
MSRSCDGEDNSRRPRDQRKEGDGSKSAPVSPSNLSLGYADSLYEIGIRNTPLTVGLNLH